MPRFLSALLFGILVATSANAGCNDRYYVCDNPSYEQIIDRANAAPVLRPQRRQLGTDWATTHENVLNAKSYIIWSCIKTMLVTELGNVNAAVCMPAWMRRVPPTTELEFVFQEDVTRKQKFRRVLYLVTNQSQADNLQHQFR